MRDLFNILEDGFHPLDLCQKAESKLKALESVTFKLSAEVSVKSIEVSDFIPLLKTLSVLAHVQSAIKGVPNVEARKSEELGPISSILRSRIGACSSREIRVSLS